MVSLTGPQITSANRHAFSGQPDVLLADNTRHGHLMGVAQRRSSVYIMLTKSCQEKNHCTSKAHTFQIHWRNHFNFKNFTTYNTTQCRSVYLYPSCLSERKTRICLVTPFEPNLTERSMGLSTEKGPISRDSRLL